MAAFNASSEDARLKIMDDHFALNVDQVGANQGFWGFETCLSVGDATILLTVD